ELRLLEKIGPAASIDTAFLQAQRCLSLLRSTPSAPWALDGRLENYVYSPDTFCRFLADLERGLDVNGKGALFPDVLEVDGLRFLKVDGQMQLEKEEDFWSWKPPREPFVASRLAIFLPRAASGELPLLHYSPQRRDPGSFHVAQYAKELSVSGAA